MSIPVIDLFAGPGGLGEGFSSLINKDERIFRIILSIEKDKNAHKTLELRSFFRQFSPGKVPQEYYDVLKEDDLHQREILKKKLFQLYPDYANKAKAEAWLAELGSDYFPPDKVDEKIRNSLNGSNKWVLIGGPPCQAYSKIGRSRVGGIHEKDPRVYLYKEYLRIIAKHHPSVFVMENVEGLLSAKVNDQKVFHLILRDLKNPGNVFPEFRSPLYKIYSLVTENVKKDKDYLIKAENYGIPQMRHRVILLGIRDDINIIPATLNKKSDKISLESVIGGLPKVRSGLNRQYSYSEYINGKKKRIYQKLKDSNDEWKLTISGFFNEISSWNGLSALHNRINIGNEELSIGSEFMPCMDSINKNHPLYKWFTDKNLEGVPNHQSRSHLKEDLKRYLFASIYAQTFVDFPRLNDYAKHSAELIPDHKNADSGKFNDRFKVQLPFDPASTITSHISKDGHYYIHYDPSQCRSLTVREAARIQTFPDNYLFCGSRTQQFHQVGNAVPPLLAYQIADVVHKIFLDLRIEV